MNIKNIRSLEFTIVEKNKHALNIKCILFLVLACISFFASCEHVSGSTFYIYIYTQLFDYSTTYGFFVLLLSAECVEIAEQKRRIRTDEITFSLYYRVSVSFTYILLLYKYWKCIY